MIIKAVIRILAIGLLCGYSLFGQRAAPPPAEIQDHFRRAQQHTQANRPDLAIAEYRAVLERDPKNVDARGNIGVLLFFQGQYDKAAPELRQALKGRPGLWKIQTLLGMCERRIGRFSDARANLEQAFPHLDETRLRIQSGMELIEIYFASNDLDKAAGVVSVLRQLEPANIEVLYTAQRIHSSLADESMLAIAMLDPKSARMHRLMAHELARQGDSKGAISHYKEALKIAPQLPGLHFELAEILHGSNDASDAAEAEQEYKAALQVNPFDATSQCRLGEIAAKRADQKSAHEYYSRALAIQPDNAEANLGMARVLVSMNQPDKAEPLLERAVRLDPANATAHFRLAALYRTGGKAEAAARELEEFRKLKNMKDTLRETYREMRITPSNQDRPDTAMQPE